MDIKTTFIGPKNNKGATIQATFNTKKVTIAYDYSLDSEDRHYKAAKAFADKHGLVITNYATAYHNKGYMFRIIDIKN